MGIFRPKKMSFFRVPRVRTASPGCPGPKRKIMHFTRKKIGKSKNRSRKLSTQPHFTKNMPNPEGNRKLSTQPGLRSRYTGIAALRWRRIAPLAERCEGARRLGSGGTRRPGPMLVYPGVSLEATRASHSRLQGRPDCDFRKFRKIDFPDFFVKKSGKIRKIGFLDSRDQNKILKF